MDRLRSYQVFALIVARGGFARAAAELGISPANASRLVQQLEQALGTKLLERTSRRVALTDSGRGVYDRVRGILDEVADLEAAFSDDGRHARGRLRINAPMTFGLLWLAPLVPDFAGLHPAIELDIRCSDRVVEMAEDSFDLAVRISAAGAANHVSRRLATVEMLLCASPALAGGATAVGDLRRMPRLGYQFSDDRNAWTLSDAAGASHRVDSPCAVTCASGLAMKATALRGEGVALLPDFLIHHEMAAGELVPVLPGLRAESLQIRAVYPDRRHLSRRARLFIDFLAERFRTPPWRSAQPPAGVPGNSLG